MTLQEIKQAIEGGQSVHWSNTTYTVKKQESGDYLIVSGTGHAIGLTWTDGVTLNGKEQDFFTVGLKTKLPESIKSVDEAKAFLRELHANGEHYHPEDDAHQINWDTCTPTETEKDKLNKLRSDIYTGLNGGDHRCPVFCPCGYLTELDHADEKYFVKDKSGRDGHYEATYSDLVNDEELKEDDEFQDWLHDDASIGSEYTEFNNKVITRIK